MADVCPSHDDRLIEAAHWCPADVAAAGALVTSAGETTATVGGHSRGAGTAAEI